MSQKIMIDFAFGDPDKEQLVNCFFLPSETTPGAFDFYNPDGELLASGITGTSFQFSFGKGEEWTISELTFAVRGKWHTVPVTGDEEGSFQGQSGGGGAEEERYGEAAGA